MKKTISFLLIFFLFAGLISAQNNEAEIQALLKKIQKSDQEIKDAKKNVKYQTWAKRGKLFLDVYTINTKMLAPGLNKTTIQLLGKSDSDPTPFYGKPGSVTTENDFEVWEYKRIKIYFKDNLVDHWVETMPVDTLALDKAYEAFKKAIELDESGKYVAKKSTKEQLAQLREYLMNKAVGYYQTGNSELALSYLEKSIDLLQYPRTDADTLIQPGAYYYYAAIFAYNSKKLDKSEMYFQKSIDEKYQIGDCYQYIAQVMYEEGDSAKAVKTLEQGAEKFPDEPKIIYSLIDYYTPRGQYDKAFEYIDKAIAMTPDNGILYIVKGNAYNKIFEELQKNYLVNLLQADSVSKAAFRNRNNPEQQKKDNELKDQLLAKIPDIETKMNNYAENTLKAYELGISKDPKNADFYYAVMMFYYNRAAAETTVSSKMSKLTDYIKKLSDQAGEDFIKAKEYGEKAYELNPNDTYTIDKLASIYYRLKMYDKSTEMRNKLKDMN